MDLFHDAGFTGLFRRMNMWIDVSLHTYIHKYSDFLVVLISVGLAQARPNYIVVSPSTLYPLFSVTLKCVTNAMQHAEV